MNSKLTGEGAAADDVKKKPLQFSAINMKSKFVQHVPRIIFNVFKRFQVFQNIPSSQLLLTFRHFLMTSINVGDEF